MLGETTETAWMPDWYPLVQAAKYLGVAPWDLLEQSAWWRDRALIAMSAERQAKQILDNHQ